MKSHSSINCDIAHISSTPLQGPGHRLGPLTPYPHLHETLKKGIPVGSTIVFSQNPPFVYSPIVKGYVYLYYLESVKSKELLSLNFNK